MLEPSCVYLMELGVQEDVAAYRKNMEWQTSELLFPHKKMCALKKVQVGVVVLESDNVANAVAEEFLSLLEAIL
ncbi:hypothetical protein ABKV19_014710 [Rosa sericea]